MLVPIVVASNIVVAINIVVVFAAAAVVVLALCMGFNIICKNMRINV